MEWNMWSRTRSVYRNDLLKYL